MNKTTNLPLATSKQFRKVARAVLKQRGVQVFYGYTDQTRDHLRTNKRYCSYWIGNHNRNDEVIIKQIEFALWCQGATAHTRMHLNSLRGTCMLEK